MAIPVFVINRNGDAERLSAFREAADSRGVPFERLVALDGHRPGFPFALYDDLIGAHFWGEDQAKPGAIGCYLSHRRAWQTVLDLDLERALICEDDALLNESTERLESKADLLAPFDLLFANGRMAALCAAMSAGRQASIPDIYAWVASNGGPKKLGLKPSPGADCYVITKRGAERLLALTAEQKIICGVDWAMIWNALGSADDSMAETFPELGILRRHLPQGAPALTAHALARPVATQRVGVPSVIRHKSSVPITELTDRKAVLAHAEYVSNISLLGASLCFAGRSGPDPVMDIHRRGEIWDEPGLRALLRRFPEGGTFVDIGAHLGNHSIVMGKLGGAASIIAVEPNAELHRLFSTNLAMNHISGRTLLAEPGIAIWNVSGDGWLLRNRKRSSESMVKAELPSDAREGAEPVRLITGDELIGGRQVHAIKIDTSGSEPEVIRGLDQTLARARPLLLVDHAAQGLERIARLAEDRGYRVDLTVPSSRQNRVSSLLVPRPDGAR